MSPCLLSRSFIFLGDGGCIELALLERELELGNELELEPLEPLDELPELLELLELLELKLPDALREPLELDPPLGFELGDIEPLGLKLTLDILGTFELLVKLMPDMILGLWYMFDFLVMLKLSPVLGYARELSCGLGFALDLILDFELGNELELEPLEPLDAIGLLGDMGLLADVAKLEPVRVFGLKLLFALGLVATLLPKLRLLNGDTIDAEPVSALAADRIL